jgi:6,7-dimethyl-8-ribityllumazine synthase
MSARILIIEATFYPHISEALREGAMAALEAAGAEVDRVGVPGVLEIPAALAMAVAKERFEGYVLLGCVIRGETSHYEIVAGESARAVMDLAVAHRLAFGNGILTVENELQAVARARRDGKDKGGGAARAALAMIEVRKPLMGTGTGP